MTLKRKWVAECDTPGCEKVVIVPLNRDGFNDKSDAGMYVNDQDWDASPTRAETLCPEHRPALKDPDTPPAVEAGVQTITIQPTVPSRAGFTPALLRERILGGTAMREGQGGVHE